MSYVIDEGVARLPAVADADVPGGARPWVRRQDALVRVQHDGVGGVLEAAEDPPLAGVGVDEQAQGVVGMGRDDHGVEPLATRGRRDVTPNGSRTTSVTPAPVRTAPAGSAATRARDVRRRAAADDAPLRRVADADEAVVVEEAQEVVDRERMRSGRRRWTTPRT